MLLMQIPIQIGGVPAAPAPQRGAAPADFRSLCEDRALGAAPPPLSAVACRASRGSKNHFKGQCRPCRFHLAPEECPRGEACNFCHFPHGAEKLAQMDAFSSRAKGRRPRTGAEPRQAPPGLRLSLCDHLDLVGSWSGRQQPASSSGSICSWSGSELAEAPARGAAWQGDPPGRAARALRRLSGGLAGAASEDEVRRHGGGEGGDDDPCDFRGRPTILVSGECARPPEEE
ncbi:unnamed protein product [Prorocentrum cordatum]|uniref:C3H1-type domain-containing protein n=1 Tax=Prorocentrum cordatum TaxID=2364126 RepID=A0ABN9QIW0_9DINO|nr:unnamed protein product [Polarella glacialis]